MSLRAGLSRRSPTVGDADEVDGAPLDRLLVRVERPGDLLQAEVGHVLVDLARELDELGVEVVLARLPGEVEGVDRQAMAS
jgi:hypothetical protein